MRDGKTLVSLVALVVLGMLGVVALLQGGHLTASTKRIEIQGSAEHAGRP